MHPPLGTSALWVSFCSVLRTGKKSRFCSERLALGFCSCNDMLSEKTTGSSLSRTGSCKFIREFYASLHDGFSADTPWTFVLWAYHDSQAQILTDEFGRWYAYVPRICVTIILEKNTRASYPPHVCLHCVVHHFTKKKQQKKNPQTLQKMKQYEDMKNSHKALWAAGATVFICQVKQRISPIFFLKSLFPLLRVKDIHTVTVMLWSTKKS